MLQQSFERPVPLNITMNVGAGLDIPSGYWREGRHGEMILIGGLGAETGILGRANRFKTTIGEHMQLTCADRMLASLPKEFIAVNSHCTEGTLDEISKARLMYHHHPRFAAIDPINNGNWMMTGNKQYSGNKWFDKVKDFCNNKYDNRKKLMVTTPFFDRDGVTPLKIIVPSHCFLDSITKFETDQVQKIQDDCEIDDSDGNMVHMRNGQAKKRMFMDMPHTFGRVNHHIIITAWVDDKIVIQQGPGKAPPAKKLTALKGDDAVKGVPGDFFFLTNITWQALTATELFNKDRESLYPKDNKQAFVGDTELMEVGFYCVRSKSGTDKYTIPIIVSKNEGVLPTLTEFSMIKEDGRFGLASNTQNYDLDLYPGVMLSRTTVRSKIDSDPLLSRAINITSELNQMRYFHRHLQRYFCTPKELYEDIKKLGYDWNMILSETRGWWGFNDEDNPLKFLSTFDLLRIRAGEYKPYWL